MSAWFSKKLYDNLRVHAHGRVVQYLRKIIPTWDRSGSAVMYSTVQYSTVQYGGTTSTNVPAAHDDVDEDPNPAGDEHH